MNIKLREIIDNDIYAIYELSNLPSTRKYSLNSNTIDWKAHSEWFQNMIKDDDCLILVVNNGNGTLLGQVRFEIDNDIADISISLTDEIKGRGYALDILQKSQDILLMKREIKKIIATINNENAASIKLFQKAGYLLSEVRIKFSKYVLFLGGSNE